MQSVSSFLKSVLDFNKEKLAEQLQHDDRSTISSEDVAAMVEASDVQSFHKAEIVEYLDANKDALLDRVRFNENDPVRISDDYAPHAGKHGVVISRASGTEYLVRFHNDAADYTIPVSHMSHHVEEQVQESKILVLTQDGIINEVTVQGNEWAIDSLEEELKQEVLAVFPAAISEELQEQFKQLSDVELTESQAKVRNDIMAAAKTSISVIQEKYGDLWTDCLYSMATMQALSESDEGSETEVDNVVFDDKNQEGDHIVITKGDGKFSVCVKDKTGDCIEQKDFATIEEAEKLAQSFM